MKKTVILFFITLTSEVTQLQTGSYSILVLPVVLPDVEVYESRVRVDLGDEGIAMHYQILLQVPKSK